MRACSKLFLVVLLALPCAWPQASTSTVNGTVRDPSGAVIPHTVVSIANTETNVAATTRTNDAGFYLFPGLVPGPYRLTVEVPGMLKYEGSFIVQVAQTVGIDPVLKLAQVGSKVEVTEVTPMVTTENATLRDTMDYARIKQLPINGRTVNGLIATLPGSEGYRSFGLPANAQEWVLDGAVLTDRRWNMAVYGNSSSLGAVQEFTMDNGAVSAKNSRPNTITVSTKSGTNQLHGTASDTHRNNSIGLARARTDYYDKAPQLIRNEYFVNAGGPVFIPGLYNGKNRTFWFVNYEGIKQRQAATTSYNVPTIAMRNGDFSGLVDAQGRLQTLYDPLTTDSKTGARQPFSYGGRANVIDPKRISPVAKYLFEITPLPTSNVNPLIDNNWFGPIRTTWDAFTWTARVDHRFSDRDSFYARMSYYDKFQNQSTGQPFLNDVPGHKWTTDGERSVATSWVHTFSPTFFSELVLAARYRIGGGRTGTNDSVVGTD